MIKSSIFCAFIIKFFHVLTDSAIVRGLTGAMRFFGVCFKGSIPGRILLRKNSTDDYVKTSVFYRGLSWIWKKCLDILGTVYKAFGRMNAGSINYRFFDKTVKHAYVMQPDSILCFCILLIFVVPHAFWNNLYATLLVGMLSAIYLANLLSGKKEFARRMEGVWFSFILFAFSTGLSILGSPALGDSIRVFIFFGTAFLMCLSVYGMLSSYEKMEKLLGFMLLAVAFTACFAIYQRLTGVKADASLTDMKLNAGMPGRVDGTLGNPNNFAEFLMLFIPFVFAWTINQKKKLKICAGLAAVALGVVALLLTYSRSGWIAFAVAALVFVALYNWKWLPFVALFGVACIPLLPQSIINRILTIGNLQDTSSSYRVDIWTGAIRMLRDGYWFHGTGLGAEAFTSIFPTYGIGASKIAPHTHMQFMEILTEMGILGFLSLLWYSISLVRRTAVAVFTADKKLRNVLSASAASMAGITAIGFAEYTWFYPRVMLAFFITAGISMAAVRLAKRGAEETK